MNKKRPLQLMTCMILLLMVVSLFFAGCGAKTSGQNGAPSSGDPATQTTAPIQKVYTPVGEMYRHMTYNIAGSNGLERIPNFDLNEEKRENIKKTILEANPDTFGIQEAPKAWIEGMVSLLDGKYTMVGGSYEGINNEKFWFNPIYYKADKFNCLDSGVMFLNEGFTYSNNNRNCAYALLERMEDQKLILLVSLHLEHRPLGTEDLKNFNYTNYLEMVDDRNILRDKQIEFLCQIVEGKLAEYKTTYGKDCSLIISGDFNINSWQDDQYTNEYTRLVQSLTAIPGVPGVADSVVITNDLVTNQTRAKWQTYRDYFAMDCATARLDYIFVSVNMIVDRYVVYPTNEEMSASSDHFATYIEYHIGE